jgi:hypothetical protein
MPLYEPTPTHYFDPTATTSTGAGTFANPYNSIAQVVAGFTGNMAGQVLGIKRGTVVRVPSSGFTLDFYGTSAGGHAQIRPYGDALNDPIITGAQIRRDWIQDTVDSRIWYLTGVTAEQSVWQSNIRMENKSSYAAMQAAGRGSAFWNSSSNRMHIFPLDTSSPNGGQTEMTTATNALYCAYSNVAATGFMTISGLEFRGSRDAGLAVYVPGSTGSITSIGPVHVIGNKFRYIGADSSAENLGASGVIVYSLSDAVRFSFVNVSNNVGHDILNNLIESGGWTTGLVSGNSASFIGANVHELWFSVSGTDSSYNTLVNGVNPATRRKVYHASMFWQTGYTTAAGASPDSTKFNNNRFFGNFCNGVFEPGIDLSYGTNTSVFNNTIYNTSLSGAGAPALRIDNGSAVINNNLLHLGATGAANLFGNTGTTLTGDRNVYSRVLFGGADMYWNGVFQSGMTAWKAAATPQFQNDSAVVPGSLGIDSNYMPTTGSVLIGGGGTVSGWNYDLDGDAVRGTVSVGCYQQRFAMMTQRCTSES